VRYFIPCKGLVFPYFSVPNIIFYLAEKNFLDNKQKQRNKIASPIIVVLGF